MLRNRRSVPPGAARVFSEARFHIEFCRAGNQDGFQEINGVILRDDLGVISLFPRANQNLLKERAKAVVGLRELCAVQGKGDERGNLRDAVDLFQNAEHNCGRNLLSRVLFFDRRRQNSEFHIVIQH